MHLCVNCGSPSPGYVDKCPRCNSWLREPRDTLIGSILAEKYRIEEHLGAGGMCNVYRARHVLIGKQVAIKTLKSELAADPKIAERFKQEALAASRVRHPNAIDVTDYGVGKDNVPFIVMELVNGSTLGQAIRGEGPFTIERAADVLRQVCGALEVAHQVGVIHRDIKPDNILISEHEGRDWVEVTDFGVAKIQEDVNRRAPITGANFIIGTPRYMSPEQCEGHPVDARSDIYSLAVVVYEMLAGDVPFEGNSTRLLIAHSTEPPAPLRDKRPDISPEVEAVVMRALEKDPSLRPQSASDFYMEFASAAGLDQDAGTSDADAFSRVVVNIDERLDEEQSQGDYTDIPGVDDEATLVRVGKDRRSRPPRIAAVPEARSPRRAVGFLALAGILVLIGALALIVFVVSRDRTGAAPEAGAQDATKVSGLPDKSPENTEERADAPSQPNQAEHVDLEESRRQVEAAIYSWASALEDRNLRAHMDSYAPHLDIYYLKRGVNRVYVQADRAQALSKYSDLSFRFSNMNINMDRSGNRAVATFNKEWDFRGEKNSAGSVREMVWLERIGGKWRITGERDLKVHYVRNG
jgi:serine/threonine-protein kinase